MKIIDKKIYKEMCKKGINPIKHGKKENSYGIALKNLLVEHGINVGSDIGVEIGCGVGRNIFRISTSFKMEGIEASKLMAYHQLVNSYYLHRIDFLKDDISSLKNRYSFIIIDNMDFDKDDIKIFEERLDFIRKEESLLIFTGSESDFNLVKKFKSFESHVEHNDLIDIYFEDDEYDFKKENFHVFASGYDTLNPIPSLTVEEEYEEDNINEKLDSGEAIQLTAQQIKKCKNKSELETLYKACKLEYKSKLTAKVLKSNLIKHLGL